MKNASLANKDFRIASDAALDNLTHLAGRVCNVPIALIDFADADFQWSKLNANSLKPEIFRETALYGYAVRQSNLFIVNDALADEQFANTPLIVSGSQIRFCAAAPILMSDGHPVGMLCVMDFVPREMILS